MTDLTDNEQAFRAEFRDWIRALPTPDLEALGRVLARLVELNDDELAALDGAQR